MKLQRMVLARRWIAVACTALLAGCSSADKDIEDDVEKLSKLPPATQVAYALRTPLCIFGFAALAWAINGVSLITFKGKS